MNIIASLLAFKGYANLVGFSNGNMAHICYFTDPVCAHLAMAMMDEEWCMEVRSSLVQGESKQWWVKQAVAAFSGGLCKPPRGDVGEIFVALYLPFCADILRKEIGPEYRHFSVSLDRWVSILIASPANYVPTNDDTKQDKPRTRIVKKAWHPVLPHVGLISNMVFSSEKILVFSIGFLLTPLNLFATNRLATRSRD
jgi:hypothetical protein